MFNFLNRGYLKYINIAIICIFVVLLAVQAGKSFVLDEIDFPLVSHATSESGKPIYYHGEDSPQHVGTYHPTLYINSLALFIRAFGFNETSIRMFGGICILLSAYLLVLIYRLLAKKKNDGLETLFLGLYLLNPYTLANATLPDIDSTILPVVLLLFIYVSMRYFFQKKLMDSKSILVLSGLFALTLWSKLTTPLILPVFLVCVAFIASKDYKKSFVVTAKVAVTGFATFATTYFLYCIFLGLSPTYTYSFLVDSFTKGTSSEGVVTGVLNNLENLRHFIYWPTLPIVIVVGVALFGVMLDKTNDDKTRLKKLIVLMAILTTLFYIALIAPFGGFFKYPFPVFGIFLLAIVFLYERYLKTVKINLLYVAASLVLGLVVEKIFWKDSMFLSNRPFEYLLALLVIIVAAYILLVTYASRQIVATSLALLIFFSIGFQLNISRVQAIAPYPTKYLYGQTGLDETASYLRLNTKPDEIIWSMKDVGYYANRRYYESYGYYFDNNLKKQLIDMLEGGKVRYYIVTTGIGQDNIDYYTNIRQILDTYATRDKQFGNYIIYKAKE